MNVSVAPLIRLADSAEAMALAKLIDIAGEGIPNWLWTQSCTEGQTPLEIGAERAKRSDGGFSYRNALVAATEIGNPLGMVLSYAITEPPKEDPNDLPAPITPFVALEKRSVASWYINALAIFPEHRNKGIGSKLLSATEELATNNGFNVMSIQVYAQNLGAVRLYKRLGYTLIAKEPVRSHPAAPYYTGDVLLMKKTLQA